MPAPPLWWAALHREAQLPCGLDPELRLHPHGCLSASSFGFSGLNKRRQGFNTCEYFRGQSGSMAHIHLCMSKLALISTHVHKSRFSRLGPPLCLKKWSGRFFATISLFSPHTHDTDRLWKVYLNPNLCDHVLEWIKRLQCIMWSLHYPEVPSLYLFLKLQLFFPSVCFFKHSYFMVYSWG